LGTGLGSSDGRIVVVTNSGNSEAHGAFLLPRCLSFLLETDIPLFASKGFDGRSNKLRHMVPVSPSSFLALSFIGDITEFSLTPQTHLTTSRRLHRSTQDVFRIDDFAWSREKETLVVGYLGAGGAGEKGQQPPNQVVLYRREVMAVRFSFPLFPSFFCTDSPLNAQNGETVLHESPVDHNPHSKGGVSAVAVVPSGRLQFVTGGEDKKCVHPLLPLPFVSADSLRSLSQDLPLDSPTLHPSHFEREHPYRSQVDHHRADAPR
jgi:hypothetical protein